MDVITSGEISLITTTADAEPSARELDDEIQVVVPSDEEARAAFWQNAERMLEDHRALLVVPIDGDVGGLLAHVRAVLADERAEFEAVLDELLASRHPLSRRRSDQARRNALAKRELVERYGALTSADIAAASSRAKNAAQTAYRWSKANKIFSVPYNGQDVYLGFQFDDDGRPLPAVKAALEVLRGVDLSEWEIAFWFTAPTGWLSDRAPIDVLDDPARIADAARSTYEPTF
jgi:hypothetical protein